MSLYEILRIDKSVSPSDIKKAYHKLALECHPDKAGEQGTERFKEVQRAYSVLSDPSKKKMYDAYGDSGLDIMESGGLGPAIQHPLFVAVVGMLLWIVSFLFLLQLIFLVLKVDGARSDWSWATTLAPVWVFEALLGIVVVAMTVSLVKQFHVQLLIPFTLTASTFVLPITIVLALEGQITSWSAALSPIVIQTVLSLCLTLPTLRLSAFKDARERAGLPTDHIDHCSPNYWTHLLTVLISALYGPALYGLLSYKLDHAAWVSYYVVFSPVFVYTVFGFTLQSIGAVLDGMHMSPSAPFLTRYVLPVLGTAVGYGIPAAFMWLLAAKLEGADLSLAVVFVPLWIFVSVLNIITLCLCCVGCVQGASGASAKSYSNMEGTEDTSSSS